MTEANHGEYPLQKKPDEPLWSENFFLNFVDPGNGISAFFSIGTWYADTSVWREVLCMRMPSGEIITGKNFGRNTTEKTVSAALSRYEIVEPEKTVNLSYRGPVVTHSFETLTEKGFLGGGNEALDIHLMFQSIAPLWDFTHGEREQISYVGGHTEQLGQCSGYVRFKGREWTVKNASSCRDHSRGRRDFAPYKTHSWTQCSFPGGRGFQLMVANVHGQSAPAMNLAAVVEDGRLYEAKIGEISFLGSPRDFGKEHVIVLNSALGEMTINVKKALATFPVSIVDPFDFQPGINMTGMDHVLVLEEAFEMEWNGELGYGWCERGISQRRASYVD